MGIEQCSAADITVLRVDGDLAGSNAEQLRTVAKECLRQGKTDFVIDLDGAQSCDSQGLEALTWLQRECQECLGLVKLCSLNDTIKKILELTRLDDRFQDHYETF